MTGAITLRGGPFHGWIVPVQVGSDWSPSYVVVEMTPDGPIRADYLLCTEGGVSFYSFVKPPEIGK